MRLATRGANRRSRRAHGRLLWSAAVRATILLLALLTGLTVLGCKGTVEPGSRQSAVAMGDWYAWRDLTPLIEVAESHAPEPAVRALKDASKLVRDGKAASADKRLADAASGAGRQWVAVARADLAALHFSMCIRGVAWRLVDGEEPSATERKMDFSEQTKVEPGDVSVFALLTNLDEPVASDEEALAVQARIARARVAAFSQRCPANDEVAEMSASTLEADLATLAAEGHLTPDLAYLWAGVQMNRFSGTAARPFLLQAREGGFDHPAVTFMLAVIALEEEKLDEADSLASESIERYAQLEDSGNVGEGWFVRGEVARARKDDKGAKAHYAKALTANPLHAPSILATATIIASATNPDDAVDYVAKRLQPFMLEGTLDAEGVREVGMNLESVVFMATEPLAAQISRDALLTSIDSELDPMRRGLRYFFAATLDVRLGEYEVAHGHGVLAKEEFAESGNPPPVDIEQFLQRVAPR